MTHACLRLDDYLDGRLPEPEAEAFEAHTAACATCDAALDDALALPELALLRDESCPPAVLEVALAAARPPIRRADDRPVARIYRMRWGSVALGLAALLALAVGLSMRPATENPTPAPIAEAMPPADLAPRPVDATPPDDPRPIAEAAPLPAPAPPAPQVVQASQPLAAAPEAAPDAAPEPTAEEIEAAQRDIALAFALVADAQDRAGEALRSQAGPVAATLHHALPF